MQTDFDGWSDNINFDNDNTTDFIGWSDNGNAK